MEPEAIGAAVFAFIIGSVVGAQFHRWMTSRAQEVKAKISELTHDASDKIAQVTKDL